MLYLSCTDVKSAAQKRVRIQSPAKSADVERLMMEPFKGLSPFKSKEHMNLDKELSPLEPIMNADNVPVELYEFVRSVPLRKFWSLTGRHLPRLIITFSLCTPLMHG